MAGAPEYETTIYTPETEEKREAEISRRINEVIENKSAHLDLGGLDLVEIPQSIIEIVKTTRLDWVTHLYLGPPVTTRDNELYPYINIDQSLCNNIRILPKIFVDALPNLIHLDLTHNEIGVLGAKVIAKSFPDLKTLYLFNSRIGDEGTKAIAKSLTKLTTLFLGWNNVGLEGAKAIAASLKDLSIFYVNNNEIGDEGAQILAKGLSKLEVFYMGWNKVEDEGAVTIATHLPELTTLYLNNNAIKDRGANNIAQHLKKLDALHISNNGIGNDSIKTITKSLKTLSTLDLSQNNIDDKAAKRIAGSLSLLTTLNLEGNNIGDEGADAIASSLRQLKVLNLKNNKISILKKEELDTTDAQALISLINRYYNATDLERLNEAKLIIVGNEAVGKTSLVRYLVKNLPRNDSEQKTPGLKQHERIATTNWKPDGSDIKLNIWDFGGQDIYHNIHSYFLTERSLYLLVLEDRRENEGDAFRDLHHWMKIIRDRAGNAPVLIVVNKSEEGKEKLRLDEDGLHREYSNIVGFIRSSCDDSEWARNTIQALRETILQIIKTDGRMKHVYDRVTPAFLRIKQDIIDEADEKKILTQSRFSEICAHGREGNIADNLTITDRAEQRATLSTLDYLGVIVAKGYDRDTPLAIRYVHILDPTWLTDAIYKIITKTREDVLGNGKFTKECLDQWLDPDIYTDEHHEYVLEMMQSDGIGLCLKLPDVEPATYLVPESLSPNSPDLPIPKNALRFRFKYNLLLDGLIPRFIVEANHYIRKNTQLWRTGATLRIHDCHVHVQGDIDQKVIDITIICEDEDTNRNKKQRDLISALSTIRQLFRKVHQRHKEIRPIPYVPFPDNPNNEMKYDELLQLEKNPEFGPDYKVWKEGSRTFMVKELLDGVGRKSQYEEQPNNTPTIILTGPASVQHTSISGNNNKIETSDTITVQTGIEKKSYLSDWQKFSFLGSALIMLASLISLSAYYSDLSYKWKLGLGGIPLIGAIAMAFLLARNPSFYYRRMISILIASVTIISLMGQSLINLAEKYLGIKLNMSALNIDWKFLVLVAILLIADVWTNMKKTQKE